MSPGTTELTVSKQEAGLRLDRFLAGPVGSRAQAQSLIDAGRVRVNGHARAKRQVVRAGDVVEIAEGESSAEVVPASAAPFSVA